jgi:hypothetical protein
VANFRTRQLGPVERYLLHSVIERDHQRFLLASFGIGMVRYKRVFMSVFVLDVLLFIEFDVHLDIKDVILLGPY